MRKKEEMALRTSVRMRQEEKDSGVKNEVNEDEVKNKVNEDEEGNEVEEERVVETGDLHRR